MNRKIRIAAAMFSCLLLICTLSYIFGFERRESGVHTVVSLPVAASGVKARTDYTLPGSSRRDVQLIYEQMLDRLPFRFLENKGQWPGEVLFSGSVNGIQVRFLNNALRFCMSREKEAAVPLPGTPFSHDEEMEYLSWQMRFAGANKDARIYGLKKQNSRINFLRGNNPEKYVIHAPEYAMIEYQEIYPGTDLRYYGADEKKLKYDFILHPGSAISSICMQYEGINGLSTDGQGALLVKHAWGDIREEAPYSYQLINGNKKQIDVRFELKGDNCVGFRISSSYDKEADVIIDPISLQWGTYMKATSINNNNYCYDMAVDGYGYVFLAGKCDNTYPAVTGYQTTHSVSTYDVFVSKLDREAATVIYTTYMGGTGSNYANAIAVSNTGEAYFTGYTQSNNFPILNAAQPSWGGGTYDAYVAKLSSSGTALLYSTFLGGTSTEYGQGITVNAAGQAYVTGQTVSGNFPVTAGAFQTSYGGGFMDCFVTKLNSSGNTRLYSTFIGGNTSEQGYDIALGAGGEAYITGMVISTNYPTLNPAQASLGGSSDVFITKLNSAGSALLYSTYLGGSGAETGFGITVNAGGEAFVTGKTYSGNFPVTAGAYQTSLGSGGFDDAFVTKLNTSGSTWLYSTLSGGSGTDDAYDIAINASNEAYISGYTNSSNYPTTAGSYQPASAGNFDIFITLFNSSGSALLCSSYLGGASDDYTNPKVKVDLSGVFDTLVISGTSHSDPFPTTAGVYGPVKINSNGDQPVVVKMVSCVPGALPVGLLSFDGYNTGGYNILEWETAEEVNNDFFIVERSSGNGEFFPAGQVKGAGNSSGERQYTFADDIRGINNTGIFYYRLKQTDYNRKSFYSAIISVNLPGNGSFYMRETSLLSCGLLRISFTLPVGINENISAAVFDLAGREIVKKDFGRLEQGNYTRQFDAGISARGIYFVKLFAGQRQDIKKVAAE